MEIQKEKQMFNFFKSKKTDLELIKQLEQTIGKNLPKLDKIKWRSVGYVQNEHNQITELVLYRCGLKELPPEIVNLQNLTRLDLDSNQLSSLPPEIGNLQNLTELNLSGNQLSTLPHFRLQSFVV
ncbi:MAG: hypothetical protein DRQ49_04230 [Gammaproteobacteria bacterium]|nr:MAG: hypothetical protein DRQ41_14455 [Gammaproteobacteria bacterium]RKZ41694.1 MAG: hypothetical protein DRQ49_04230 [Gammaproteobacteria bacterium]RKZ75162.1 MAG: hypothetical protein DRQ57_08575 [Gammaproteobacteria bacterium]